MSEPLIEIDFFDYTDSCGFVSSFLIDAANQLNHKNQFLSMVQIMWKKLHIYSTDEMCDATMLLC